MTQKFIKKTGQIAEIFEIGLEENWTHIHYSKGSREKNACILKNDRQTLEHYFEDFFKENDVSDDLRHHIRKFIENEKKHTDVYWKEFVQFLMKTLSSQLVFGVTIALAIFGGYKFGIFLDDRYGIYPLFTVLGFLMGMAIGGLTVYKMVLKYFTPKSKVPEDSSTSSVSKKNVNRKKNYPIIDVTMDEVRRAVRTFSDQLPKGVYRTILVNDDNSIDFEQLAGILGGIPAKKFYMSRETYDLFEENEKVIPYEMDIVQKAVDQYVKEQREYPMLKYDPFRRVNYFQLIQEHYLKTQPETQFYITEVDGLITHIKPGKKATES